MGSKLAVWAPLIAGRLGCLLTRVSEGVSFVADVEAVALEPVAIRNGSGGRIWQGENRMALPNLG